MNANIKKYMKKISYYLLIIILLGGILISFWVWQKYFKKEESTPLLFKVERGSIRDLVKVRGEVVSQKEIELEFPFSGIVERIFVKEGEGVEKNSPLMRLDTADFELEVKRLDAALDQSKANLEKLVKGPTEEDLKVLETKLANAQKTLSDAQINLDNVKNKADTDLANLYGEVKGVLYDGYTNADYAVSKQTDEMFSNDFSDSPQLTFGTEAQTEIDAEYQRLIAGKTLKTFKTELDTLSADYASLDQGLSNGENYLNLIRNFLIKLNDAINLAVNLSSSSASSYKTNINTGLTNVNTSLSALINQKQLLAAQKAANQSNVAAAEAKVNEAKSAQDLAQSELNLKKAPARPEDAEIAKSKIQETENQIAQTREKIKKSSLFSPLAGEVKKIGPDEKEVFAPGQTAISLVTLGYKIQADVSELEIGKVREINGNEVLIQLDAFPGQELKGRVIFIEPKEILKEGDKYYRVNVDLDSQDLPLRSGMSADLTIIISVKESVLKIPGFAVFKKDNKKFVKVLENEKQKEVEIETGISDGDSVEVVRGLNQGQIIAVSAD